MSWANWLPKSRTTTVSGAARSVPPASEPTSELPGRSSGERAGEGAFSAVSRYASTSASSGASTRWPALASSPWTVLPRCLVTAPGSDAPGSDAPGSDAPGADAPGEVAPGSDVLDIGATACQSVLVAASTASEMARLLIVPRPGQCTGMTTPRGERRAVITAAHGERAGERVAYSARRPHAHQ